MKINSMKFTVVLFLIILLTGTIAGLFFIEIPVGNQEVSYVLIGSLATMLMNSLSSLFRRPTE